MAESAILLLVCCEKPTSGPPSPVVVRGLFSNFHLLGASFPHMLRPTREGVKLSLVSLVLLLLVLVGPAEAYNGPGGFMGAKPAITCLPYQHAVGLLTDVVQKSLGTVGNDSRISSEEATRLAQECKEARDALMMHWRQDHGSFAKK